MSEKQSGNPHRLIRTLKEVRAWEPSDEAVCFRYSASLRIFGAIPSLEEISTRLGLIPTHSHRRGERRGSNTAPYKHDMWMYGPTVAETEQLHVHIDALWSAIRPHRDYLLELKKQLTVDVFLSYGSNCCSAGVEIPAASLEVFTQLQIPFGLSIVVT
ncbi:MAG: DUF4279 domain-containing protein [Zavarzinella sp.]|nr:DUF4279 domain-containing protein [Zavarzinella sp.]